jgi:hypothetical protein
MMQSVQTPQGDIAALVFAANHSPRACCRIVARCDSAGRAAHGTDAHCVLRRLGATC